MNAGSSYVGLWQNNVPEGHGTWTNEDGAIYDGQWVNGLQEGHGKLILARGARFEGGWKVCILHMPRTQKRALLTSPRQNRNTTGVSSV